MKRLLWLVLFSVACRENPSPESQAVTTAAATTASETTATMTETLGTAPVEPSTAASSRPSVNGPKLLPVDVATSDPSLAAFRDELLAAVRKRDAGAVVALSDPKIRTSFGGGGGATDLRKALQEPGVWEDFEQLLTQGGQFVGEGETRSFWAPYVYSAWPDSHDAFQFLAVTGEDIPLRESANANAPVIATLSHDIVERKEKQGDWQQVKTADGHTGWVEARSVRSPVGYRAGFLKMDGKWKMNALVAGD
jgi:Bacterial SH3 domain